MPPLETPGWEAARDRKRMGWRIAAALRRYPDTKAEGWLIESCHRIPQFGRTAEGGDVLELTYHCRHRLCPECRRARAVAWAKKIGPWLHPGRFQLDGNGQLVKSGEALERAARTFQTAVEVDARVGLPERTEARCRKLDRMTEIHEEDLTPLFVTLTIPNIPHLIEDRDDGTTVNHLEEALWKPWRRMRETARRRPNSRAGRFMGLIAGGVWVTEVTWNAHRRDFHPHIHCIVWARKKFIHPKALQNVWRRYAPGAEVVDVRAVTDGLAGDLVKDVGDTMRGGLMAYLAGGFAKKQESAEESGERAYKERKYPAEYWYELARATKGRRLINTWGLLRGVVEPELEDGVSGADREPTTEGVHYLAQWDRKAQRFRVVAEWPASPDDPILSMKQRIAAGQDIAAAMRAMDRNLVHTRPIQETRGEISRARWRLTLRGSVPWRGGQRVLARRRK